MQNTVPNFEDEIVIVIFKYVQADFKNSGQEDMFKKQYFE